MIRRSSWKWLPAGPLASPVPPGRPPPPRWSGRWPKKPLGDKAFIGGNIGDPLLNYVDEMTPDDLAILEISSFQLEQMTISPDVAAILNITPNHLDRHGTMEAYTAAKRRILEFQRTTGYRHPEPRRRRFLEPAADKVHGRAGLFRVRRHSQADQEGTFLADGILHLRQHGVEIPLLRRDQIQLRGAHNVMNILAAFAIGYAAGLPLDAMLSAAEEFRGVAHRLEFVREWNGAQWYNNSIATAPERTMAAIHSFPNRLSCSWAGVTRTCPGRIWLPWSASAWSTWCSSAKRRKKLRTALDQATGPLPLTL